MKEAISVFILILPEVTRGVLPSREAALDISPGRQKL